MLLTLSNLVRVKNRRIAAEDKILEGEAQTKHT
jgi:hypothetical protein